MATMKTLTLADIRGFNPCYDPATKVPESWNGTVLDVLRLDAVPAADRIWLATRPGVLPDTILRLFAAGCARRALARDPSPDPRSSDAVAAAEKFACGEVSAEALAAAHAGAVEAWRTKWDDAAAADAAAAAADAAAAAYCAAAAAADAADAAYSDADAAYSDAAADADAAYSDADAAYCAADARRTERETQVKQLIELLEKADEK